MNSVATKHTGTRLVSQTRNLPANENDAAKEFAKVIVPFTRGELARAAKRSKDAAKAWKEGRSLPSAWSLMNIAQSIPEVRAWMCSMVGVRETPEFLDDRVMTAMMAALHQVAQQSGPDGDAVRNLLAQSKGPRE